MNQQDMINNALALLDSAMFNLRGSVAALRHHEVSVAVDVALVAAKEAGEFLSAAIDDLNDAKEKLEAKP